MALSSITRYPAGVTNSAVDTIFADLKIPNPLTYNLLYDDFNTYTAGNWTVAGTSAGVPAASASADGGAIAIPTTVTNPSETSISLPALTITPEVTKDFIVMARLRIDDAASGFLVGLSVGSAASPIGTPPVSGIYVSRAYNTNPVGTLRVGSSNVGAVTFTPTIAAATYYDVGVAYTAADGALRGFVGNSSCRIATNPTTFGAVAMGLVISTRNGSANVRTMLVDGYLVAKAR